MTASRRLAPLPLLLIGLAVLAALVLIPWVVHAQTSNQGATGRPVVLASAEGAGILFADTEAIADGNGLPITDTGSFVTFTWSYQWIRVDGDSEANVGANSASYQPVEADVGNLIKVKVSFTDGDNFSETVTSLPFGPIAELAGPSALPSTLVGNTGQSTSATANITQRYAVGFKLGDHGQGYEISSVSIELAAVPSDLTVSLWSGGVRGGLNANVATKLFDFADPSSFAVGLNKFTAPAGAFAYQNVNYFVVLSGFGSSLSIKETTSDDEDAGGETGAVIYDQAAVRALSDTGYWSISTSSLRASVLRLALEGSRRTSGILASTYAQDRSVDEPQEVISVGDKISFGIELGAADRYLIRGVSFNSDDSTPSGSGFTNPFDLRSGSRTGAVQFSLVNTRKAPGLPVWTAPQGATVTGGTGGQAYVFDQPVGEDTGDENTRRRDAVLFRVVGADSDGVDSPAAVGVSFTGGKGDIELDDPLMALLGVPLHALVQNLGQTDDGYRTVGSSTVKVLSQGFTNGSNAYVLQGIGVNVEGSGSNFPDGPTSVSVAVHADSGGKPGAKLFDLVSPTEYAAGHTFFEAPPGTTLEPSTSYVLVWRYVGGTVHRLLKTGSNGEDSGALTGFSMANTFYQGADLDNMAADPGSDVLEMAVYSRSLPNATGRPIVLASAEDAGVLAVDTSGIGDPDGLVNVGAPESTGILHDWSYRWIRVDGDTETVASAGSADYRQVDSELHASGIRIESGRYRRVEDDIGKLIKVQVSFIDKTGSLETVTSLPFGPVPGRPAPLPATTLVSNTGQSASATATITGRYNMGFELGDHGQGYEISSVSIELAAAPSSLIVSLWMGRAPGSGAAGAHTKLFDFENPSSFKAGLNGFTAPAGAFAYQNVDYFIVLSDFGSSLSIKETTSDAEDAGGETGATLYNSAGGDSSVLRLAVKGSRRDSGILASSYAQTADEQEISSLGDEWGVAITLGTADRYLIRGMSFSGDNTSLGGGFTHPFDLLDGTTELFRLINTRQISGISEWTAPQGATVAGGCTTVGMVETCETYNFKAEVKDPVSEHRIGGVVLSRYFGTTSTTEDSPKAAGVSLASPTGDVAITRLLMAVFGEPLDAMVQNLGQTDNSYRSVGGTNKVLSQGFTTGPNAFGYRLQGIGVNIEGSDDTNGNAQVPSGPTSVSVAVHADSSGKPGEKLFDLVSPTEFAAGHSFFEAPPGTNLAPNTSYVLVWRYNRGTWHRLQRTSSNSEDTGAQEGSSIANAYYLGADLGSLSEDSGGNSLEIAVYTVVSTKVPFVPGGIPVPLSWFHIPDGAYPGYQFRVLYVTHHATKATSGNIKHYNELVQLEARGESKRYPEAARRYTDQVIQDVANNKYEDKNFKAVACTTDVDAPTNTGMTGTGVPIHWLDGGFQHRDTLVANSNAGFYSSDWDTTDYGAYVTGNSASLYEISSHEANEGDKIVTGIWTGCDSTGMAHSKYHMGSAMGMATLGTPGDVATSNAPIGPTNSSEGSVAILLGENRPLYGISPIFTVVDDGSERTIWSTSMTVGPSRTSVATVITDRAGVGANHGRLLGSEQFTYEGISYSITILRTRKVTISGSVTVDRLEFQPSALFPMAADSKLALELDDGHTRRRFLLSEANRQATFYDWDEHGLTWTDGNFVEIKLIELPD